MDNYPTEYIAIAHCRHSFQNVPFAWAVFFGWPISCNAWAAGASPAGRARDGVGPHAHSQLTTRVGVEPPPKRSMIIFGATTPKLMARIIAIAVMASAMVARRRSKFAFE